MNQEFEKILRDLERREEPVLERVAGGRVYRRQFVRPERLILLGAGHVSRAVAELAAKLFEADLTEDIAGEEGMVCGGIMKIWIEDLTGQNG